MAKDPVCSMDVDESQALKNQWFSQHEGKTYYFCSQDCKEQFDQFPNTYSALGASWNADEAEGETPGDLA